MAQSIILLVEDDLDLRESLNDLLVSEGYRVEAAADGLEALSKLQSMTPPPQLIILDWMMPKMDGSRFCQERAKLAGLNAIPVLLLTADGRVQEKVKQVGAVSGLAKPVDVDVLLAAISTHIR